MLEVEFQSLLIKCQQRKCEGQTLEIKSAHKGCPERLYDTFSAFANQDDGGTLLFGLDELKNFERVGVYDPQDLQKKLMEVGEAMTPVIRPVLSVYDEEGKVFVAAEIPPVDLSERPCFKTSKGRLKGAYVRVGEGDKPMTEYEVYSYEAFRKRYRDDIRPIETVSLTALDQVRLEEYLLRRKLDRPNFASFDQDQLYELTGITRENCPTLAAVLLFCPYPQAFFPQLSIIAARVPGKEIGMVGPNGQRFTDSKRIEGSLPEMLEDAVRFLHNNMRTSVQIDPETGKRWSRPEYPADALREAVLNSLIHRDYSVYTENMPIQLTMFSDRVEIRNPGGLYGRLTVDQLGKVQPDTRNPFLVTTMESLGQTENRYSGIPRIRQAMEEAALPEPVFQDIHGEFSVCLYNEDAFSKPVLEPSALSALHAPDPKALLSFCQTPKTRKEIITYLGIPSAQYALRKYLDPLIDCGAILLSIPNRPRSPKQTYRTNPRFLQNKFENG